MASLSTTEKNMGEHNANMAKAEEKTKEAPVPILTPPEQESLDRTIDLLHELERKLGRDTTIVAATGNGRLANIFGGYFSEVERSLTSLRDLKRRVDDRELGLKR